MKNILAITILLLGSSYIFGMDSKSLVAQENFEIRLYPVDSKCPFQVTYSTSDQKLTLWDIKTGKVIKKLGRISAVNGKKLQAIKIVEIEFDLQEKDVMGPQRFKRSSIDLSKVDDLSLDKDTNELPCCIQ
ncbi:hypothetical protein H0X06_00610 [Candidatus Dependentiae bacterium]|nr:hypothetical protein [Candidatus Dependentiae bacterium]